MHVYVSIPLIGLSSGTNMNPWFCLVSVFTLVTSLPAVLPSRDKSSFHVLPSSPPLSKSCDPDCAQNCVNYTLSTPTPYLQLSSEHVTECIGYCGCSEFIVPTNDIALNPDCASKCTEICQNDSLYCEPHCRENFCGPHLPFSPSEHAFEVIKITADLLIGLMAVGVGIAAYRKCKGKDGKKEIDTEDLTANYHNLDY